MRVRVHVQPCQHGHVTIDQDIFVHLVPVSTYVTQHVKLLAFALVFVFKSFFPSEARPLNIYFREARLPPSSVCRLLRQSRRRWKANPGRTY